MEITMDMLKELRDLTGVSIMQCKKALEEAVEKARGVFLEEVKDKPEAMQEKILEGKLASYWKDRVLMEQAFIKDETKTIADLITSATQKFGERIVITEMKRFSAK